VGNVPRTQKAHTGFRGQGDPEGEETAAQLHELAKYGIRRHLIFIDDTTSMNF